MKVLVKNVLFALISLLIIGGIFLIGFVVGQESTVDTAPNYVSDSVSNSVDIDFSPFWKAWNVVDEKYIVSTSTNAVSNQERIWGAIRGMVRSLNDPYTEFLPPKENANFETTISGEFSGIGMEVGIKEGYIVVIAPLKNTPADRVGLQSEDLVLAIDGVPTLNISLDDGVNLIRGARGTPVTLTIARGEETFDVEIIRDIINIPTLDTKIVDDIFVISLYNFSANATSEFRNALRDFVQSRKHKLILDLRGNPGGFLDAAVDIVSWYLPVGKIIVTEDFGEEKHDFRSKGYNIFNDNLQMVVLVNKGSASASEIVAGALQEYNIATIVGTQTFGKGSVQELVDITENTSLKVTAAQWLTPDGRSISDGGLSPDVIVDEAPEGEELKDFQMKKAIELLK